MDLGCGNGTQRRILGRTLRCRVFTATNLSAQDLFGQLRRLELLSDCRYSLREAERFPRLEHFSRRLQPMILSVRLPTALVPAPTSNPSVFVSLPAPAEHLSRSDATVHAVPRS